MKKIYAVAFLLSFIFPGAGMAQISGPATGGVNTPISFSTSAGGYSYNWSFAATTRSVDPAQYPPVAVNRGALGVSPNYTSMVFDGTNWYSFTIDAYSGKIIRASYGADPTSPPAIATLGTLANHPGGNTTKGIDVVYDSTDQHWFAVACTGWTNGIQVFDFGSAGLGNLNPTMVTVPTNNAYNVSLGGTNNHLICNQLTMKRWNGQWLCFVAGSSGQQLTRYDLGASLGALSAASTPLTEHRLGADVYNFALYEENGQWYAIGADLGTMYRFVFGADLMNNAPTRATLSTSGVSSIRSITLIKGCDNQVYGYVSGVAPTIHKFNFGGSITNAPTISSLTLSGISYTADGTAGFAPFVYNDTLYAALSEWKTNSLWHVRLLPLTGSVTRHYDKTVSYTFTAPGTYEVNLLIDPARKSGMSNYCHTITISSGPPAQPDPYTVASAKVCRGDTGVRYTVPAVSGAASYEWVYTGGTGVTFSGTSSTAAPTNTLTFSAAATGGTLRVRAVSSGGQSAYRDTAIQVNALPTVSVSPSATQAVCDGDSVTLTATASNVDYQWKRNGTTNVGTAAAYVAKTQGAYDVTVTDKTTGCAATSGSVTVNVSPLPTVTVSPATTQAICDGDSVTLTATASNADYQWKRNGTTNVGTDGTYKAKTQGSYTVTVTDKTTHCARTSGSVTVNVNPLPAYSVTNTGSRSICDGDSLQLTVTTGSGMSYEWRQGTTVVGSNASYYAAAPGSYTVKVTNTGTNCFVISSPATTLTVNPLPTATVSMPGSGIGCTGDSVLLTAGQGTGYNYQWKNGNTNVGTNSRTYGAATTGDYKVVVTDGATQCKDSTSSVRVTILSRPSVTLGPGDTSFCAGGIATLHVSPQDTGLTYRWKNGQTTIPLAQAYFLEINETGVYRVIVGRSAVSGCEDSTNVVTVTVHALPVPSASWDGSVLHATPGYVSYQWETGGQGIAGATDSTFRPSSNGSYSVTVVDSNGCTGSAAAQNVTLGIGSSAMTADVHIYPNPAHDMVYIASPVAVTATLSNMEGKILLHRPDAHEIDMSAYAAGVYLLRISDSDGMLIRNEKLFKR